MSQWSSVKKFNQVSRGIVLYRQPSAREIAGAAKRFWTQETLCRNLKVLCSFLWALCFSPCPTATILPSISEDLITAIQFHSVSPRSSFQDQHTGASWEARAPFLPSICQQVNLESWMLVACGLPSNSDFRLQHEGAGA